VGNIASGHLHYKPRLGEVLDYAFERIRRGRAFPWLDGDG
jgi:hypothetical protein